MTVHNILSSDILHLNTFSTFTHIMLEKLLFHVIITHDALDFTPQGPLARSWLFRKRTSLYMDPSGPDLGSLAPHCTGTPQTFSNLFNLDLTVQGASPKTFSNLFNLDLTVQGPPF